VLHHLSTVDRRYAVLSELISITKPYGTVMIQVQSYAYFFNLYQMLAEFYPSDGGLFIKFWFLL